MYIRQNDKFKAQSNMDGANYVSTFMDHFSRYTHVAGINCKGDTVEVSEDYTRLAHVKKYFPMGVKRLHTECGGEYENIQFNEHYETTPNAPQHERFNCTLLVSVKNMLEQACFSGLYWEYAMDYVVYMNNRLPHRVLNSSPYEKLISRKPFLKYA